MARADEGFHNEALQAALVEALAGRPATLERLLARLGAVLTPKPNLKLAAAFGAEMAARPGVVGPLLAHLGGDDAAPDTDRAFLPIAAAHGWAGRIRAGREVEPAWAALGDLAADERAPVRLGTLDALVALAARDGGGDALVARALEWMEEGDRERRFGASALVIEALAERQVLARVRDHAQLFDFLSRSLALVAEAPRSAERSDGRRRLLLSLPRTLAAVVAHAGAGDAARDWLDGECARADHPQIRHALSGTLIALGRPGLGPTSAVADGLRATLEASAKPLRDPTRRRPGQGRGKRSRHTR